MDIEPLMSAITHHSRPRSKFMLKRIILLCTLSLLITTTSFSQSVACISGLADGYACESIDLKAFLDITEMGGSTATEANDIWGWTDATTGNEYALVGLTTGTAFVDVSDPENPLYLGSLATQTFSSLWRDIKVYNDHAFIVSEASDHGMQVFDLTQLRTVTSPPVTFSNSAFYNGFGNAHNIVINEDSGFAYSVGSNTCAGGLHMVDISDPLNPTDAGCFSTDGYTHDAQCVMYNGPDTDHTGKEVCINSNEDTITIVDVSDKNNPVQLSRIGYPNSAYVHQGWFTEDQRYFYQNDELDEAGGNTRTLIWDLEDLDDPFLSSDYFGPTTAIDHNLYVKDDLVYESNYTAGLRILDITDPLNPVEIGFFDTYPANNGASFNGAWSSYPFFESGIVIVNSIEDGLFVLEPVLDGTPPPPPPGSMHIASITTTTIRSGGGGTVEATVIIEDENGNRVNVASVTGTFSGDLSGSDTQNTNSSGEAVLVSDSFTSRPFDLGICVDNVTHATLTYDPSANADPTFACEGGDGGNAAPVANFTFTTDLLSTTFTDTSTDPDGSVVSWDWDFGDGNSSSFQNTSHTYASAGTYTVNLTVTDNLGDTGSTSSFVMVTDGSGGGTMHIENITTSTVRAGGSGFVEATFLIHDDAGNPVPDATVDGTFSGDLSGSDSGVSGSDGTVTLESNSFTSRPFDLGICADNVTHGTLVYDPAQNADPGYSCTGAAPQIGFSKSGDTYTKSLVPTEFGISQNFPNPFNPTTMIDFSMPQSQHVSIKVYNLIGQEMATLVNEIRDAGIHSVSFDASGLSNGVYLYVMETEGYAVTRRMTLMK